MCLYVYECALLERWVYVLFYVSCISFFLPIQTMCSIHKHRGKEHLNNAVGLWFGSGYIFQFALIKYCRSTRSWWVDEKMLSITREEDNILLTSKAALQ